MSDKELIKQEIERRYNCEKCYPLDREANVAAVVLEELLLFIDSLPEEPVSKDLKKAAYKHHIEQKTNCFYDSFKAGAQWQKQRMMEDAVECTWGTEATSSFMSDFPNIECGDKVKVIIVKED